jgi:hypothetical protein
MKLPGAGWLVLAAVVLALMGRLPLLLVVIIGVAGLIGWYAWSIKRRPARPCWWCQGRGVTEGSDPEAGFSRAPVGRCPVCRNTKTRPRWGTAIFNQEARRAMRADRASRPKTSH